MAIPLTVRRLLALAFCLCAGCAVSPGAKKPSAALADQAAAQPDQAPSGGPATPPVATASTNPQGAGSENRALNGNATNGGAATVAKNAPPSATGPQVLDDVLAQLTELGPIEPEARKRLADDLRKTDPAYWPMLVKTFRASLEYRRRSAQKTAEAPTAQMPPAEAQRPEIVQVAANDPIASQNIPEPSAEGLSSRPPEANGGLAIRPTEAPAPANTAPPATTAALAALPADTSKPSSTATIAPAAPSNTLAATDWRRHLDAAIAELERQTREHPGEADAWAKQVYLRLLDLAAGRRDDALKPISGVPPAQQDYWAKQIFALSTYLDQGSADPSRRAAEASLHLARAMAALGEQAPLVVHNLAFCTDVHSYGVLKRFEPAEFHAGQQVLLYAEIENFKSEENAQGFHTSLEASYQIHDRQGQRVARDDLSLTEEHCQNRRRDFFVRYFITLPKNIYEGDYTLDLTIEDKLGHKINQSSVDFSVKTK